MHPVRFQNPRDRRPIDPMANVLHRADDPGVTPWGSPPPHHQVPDLCQYAGTTAPPLRVRPFARDQLPMPPQNRVGRDDRRDLTEAATAQPVSVPRQPTAFLIGQPEPAAHVPAQDTVCFDEVGHRCLLPLVEDLTHECRRIVEAQAHAALGRRTKPSCTSRNHASADGHPSFGKGWRPSVQFGWIHPRRRWRRTCPRRTSSMLSLSSQRKNLGKPFAQRLEAAARRAGPLRHPTGAPTTIVSVDIFEEVAQA